MEREKDIGKEEEREDGWMKVAGCLGSRHMQGRVSFWPLLFRTQAVPEIEEGAVNTNKR